MRVVFFGHRDAEEAILPLLEKTVRLLIEKEKADVFYVGTQGAFDRMVQRLLDGTAAAGSALPRICAH